jgi:hypothetical protein
MAAGELSRCMFQLSSSIHSEKSSKGSACRATAASFCLTSDSRIMGSPILPTRVDVWTLRCLFNKAHYYERGLAGEIDVIEDKKSRAPTPSHPYVFNVESYYMDRVTGEQLARTHHYLRADGSIGASGKVDPKRLYVEGIHYRLRKGWTFWRDPSTLFREHSFFYRCYVRWRDFKCDHFGR